MMGYYIQGPRMGKAAYLVENHDATVVQGTLPLPSELEKEGKALICVVENLFFDAAAFAYSDQEAKEFADPSDLRPKLWLTMNLDEAKTLSNYDGRK